ncbi:MAG: PaaI family thioesterase [Anaerolineae bacterium]|nr:PaaI family thioesterase [Anaerolineae bacterium]
MDTLLERTRTVTWHDPMVTARAALEMNGLDLLRAMIRGEYPRPPIAELLDFQLLEVDEGRAVFGVEPAEFHYNPIGVVHGGLACTLLDSALGCAVQSQLPSGLAYTTIQLNVNLVRALTLETGFVRCEAQAVHVGRQMATAEARITDSRGKLYAHATTTCLVFPVAQKRMGS